MLGDLVKRGSEPSNPEDLARGGDELLAVPGGVGTRGGHLPSLRLSGDYSPDMLASV